MSCTLSPELRRCRHALTLRTDFDQALESCRCWQLASSRSRTRSADVPRADLACQGLTTQSCLVQRAPGRFCSPSCAKCPNARQTSVIGSPSRQLCDKPQALVHDRTLLPRHPHLPLLENTRGVTHVSGTICHLCLGPLTQQVLPCGPSFPAPPSLGSRHDPPRARVSRSSSASPPRTRSCAAMAGRCARSRSRPTAARRSPAPSIPRRSAGR